MIEIKDLSVHIGGFALKDLTLNIHDKEYFVVLGPSGAGKTVFMECLAGLHRLKSGSIRLNQKDITRLSPEERGLGYVPQDYVLFPFLNVSENILFGLKQKKVPFSIGQKRLKDLAVLLGITHLLERDPRTLSGGEKQRVALARALAPAPQILLLDEPLSSLDVQTSKYLRLELRRIHQEMGVTTIHITHNHVEAEELADRMAVMVAGRIEHSGSLGFRRFIEYSRMHGLPPVSAWIDGSGLRRYADHPAARRRRYAEDRYFTTGRLCFRYSADRTSGQPL
jgi:molybdate/tungstate transport system ATP-binding protein